MLIFWVLNQYLPKAHLAVTMCTISTFGFSPEAFITEQGSYHTTSRETNKPERKLVQPFDAGRCGCVCPMEDVGSLFHFSVKYQPKITSGSSSFKTYYHL